MLKIVRTEVIIGEISWSINDGNKWIPLDPRNMDFLEVRDRIMSGEQYDLDEEFRSEFLVKIGA